MTKRLIPPLALCLLATVAFAQEGAREVNLWVSRNVAPGTKIRLNLNTRNVGTVLLRATPIDPLAWHSRPGKQHERPATTGPSKMAWRTSMEDPKVRPPAGQRDRYFSRQVNLPPTLPVGTYLLTAEPADNSTPRLQKWAVVSVTDLAVVAKRSPKRVLVWVTHAKTHKALGGVSVDLYGENGQRLVSHRTGPDGVALFPAAAGYGVVVVRSGTDYAGVPTSSTSPDGRFVAHFQTDRPIYRPGQRVSFKSILRRTLDRGYVPVAKTPVVVEVRDPKDTPIDRLELESNAAGSVAGSFEIPSEGATGAYTLRLAVGKDSAYQTFTVAEYRKPEFKVEAKPAASRYLAGQEVAFTVDSAYYFGSPVPQAEVRYTVRRSPLGYWTPSSDDDLYRSNDGNLYASDTYGSDEFVAEATVHTDANGRAVIKFKSNADAPDSTYRLSVTVTDGSRRQVEGSASVPVYAAEIRLGMRVLASYTPLGKLVPVELSVRDLDNRPVGATVRVSMFESYWDKKKEEWAERRIEFTDVRVPATGTARLNLPAKGLGGEVTLRAEARDKTGRLAKTETSAYLANPFAKEADEPEEEPELVLKLGKAAYKPGETIRAFVSTNKPVSPILVVLEGQDIWGYKLITQGRRGEEWTFTAGVALSPNAHLSASQWVGSQMVMANETVPVPDPSRKMTVEVRPDKTDYRPGDTATFEVRTRDAQGRPVSAEVALSVVDEAIYALQPDGTPDLYRFYWGLRQNQVSTQFSAPEELSGGAYQRLSSVAPVRQRFEDTAYWNAFVQTDAQGVGRVSFEMPGNLTSWRATGRAITADTRVGSATSTVRANRPVTLRLATPRQMVVGDRLTIIGTVNNRTDAARQTVVALDTDGAVQRKEDVQVAAKAEGRVGFQITADTPGSRTLLGTVQDQVNPTAEFADALRVRVPVIPKGIPHRDLVASVVEREAKLDVSVPVDALIPEAIVSVRAGIRPLVDEMSARVLGSHRYSSTVAAAQLELAAARGLSGDSKEVREPLAFLSRTQAYNGWGWWENAPADPVVTAAVLRALAAAEASPTINVPDQMIAGGVQGARSLHDSTQLMEYRALLAASISQADPKLGQPMVEEVRRRATRLSPFAHLRLAEVSFQLGAAEAASQELQRGLQGLSRGQDGSTIPVGFGIGWSATQTETTAQALRVLLLSKRDTALANSLARWLARPDADSWLSLDDQASVAIALLEQLTVRPEAARLGEVTLEIDGKSHVLQPGRIGQAASVRVPLKPGANSLTLRRSDGGEAMVSVEVRSYRPIAGENSQGIRVVRRFEVLNPAGIWVELDRPVRPNEPVRCTTIAWGDSTPDAMRVIQPIPAGFEFVDSENASGGRQEVRDGAVVHYILNTGDPVTFRYYIRAESEGQMTALPATAELLRRPAQKGHSSPLDLVVKDR